MEQKKKIIIFSIVVVLVIGLGFLAYYFLGGDREARRVAYLEAYLKENWSKFVIDGSTSMIPLHEALDKKFGEGKEIKHSRTVAAFENFVDGEIDILFAVNYLDSYFEAAKEKNVVINKKPITKEALVFLKNVDFEIDNLTLNQIKQIYNQEITSWDKIDSEIFKDESEYRKQITPIYRNVDSGSGMALINLLGKNNVSCTDEYGGPKCLFITDMGGIINALADGLESYMGEGPMIAYNMYTFTEKQFRNEKVTTFKVNGVAPNDETIYNDEYPVILYNYIYYKNDNAKEFGEKLHEYLLTDVGQKLIMNNGYVPLRKVVDKNIKPIDRNCKENFVEEICVLSDGYNEYINKWIKITIDDNTEKFEYFNTVEEYIFANSSVSEKEFEGVKEILNILLAVHKESPWASQLITFKRLSNGDIELFTGNCGGSACIWLFPKDTYNFGRPMYTIEDGERYPNMYAGFRITKDFKTIYVRADGYEKGFRIPAKDLLKAFKLPLVLSGGFVFGSFRVYGHFGKPVEQHWFVNLCYGSGYGRDSFY